MLKPEENSVPGAAVVPTVAPAAPVEGHPAPYTRKRNLQHVATHDDRLRVMTWMLAKEQTLLAEAGNGSSDGGAKPETSKMAKVDRLCLATQAIAEFPSLFRGSAQANYMKASRWWKESREYIYGTSGMTGSKKARTGRGRKTNAWTSWLQDELKASLEVEGTNSSWNNKDLLVMAKNILDNSTHPEFNKDYIVPQRNCALGDLVNLRWVQNFKERFHYHHHLHTHRLHQHHDDAAASVAGGTGGGQQTSLDAAMEAKLLHNLATIRATKDGAPVVKKEVMHLANQLIREAHPMFKVDTTWYKAFCDRHPEVAAPKDQLPPAAVTPALALDEPADPTDRPSPSSTATSLLHPADTSTFHTTSSSVIDEAKAVDVFRAIAAGLVNTVKSLLLQGANTEGCDEHGCTALVVATKASHYNMVKVLLDCGAKTEATDEHGQTALVLAAASGQFHVAKSLLEHKANVEATNDQSKTPLVLAAERGDLKLVKLLVRFGANVEARDEVNHPIT
ncbi:hypothetical protein, variant 1 [Aphanomyces astaci]|uniref:Uncharacterized protein n=1 Tax=Aphanomyces astaci TaxID=112090 RepID=W4G5F7_APHAT|nr:hypothetical protein, variant 1 [Aphanomyces astaci]ETV74947.1 hypothetical protein, variant 1 [Aphanomyces astaci]|eukprot:XP_009835450.1 hypothetical protein, variant 1 [Aphanomyces astaci]